MLLAELKRMRTTTARHRTIASLIFAFSSAHLSANGAPCSGTPFLPPTTAAPSSRCSCGFRQRLGGQASRHLVQVDADRRATRGSAGITLQAVWSQCLGDLPQRGDPVPPGLFRQFLRRSDDRDGGGERGFDETFTFSVIRISSFFLRDGCRGIALKSSAWLS